MRLVACAVTALVVLGTGVASAQPVLGPDRGYWVPDRGPAFGGERPWPGPMRPRRMARLLASMGLDPVGPPVRQGNFLIQPASDDDGRAMRVTIDIETGQVVSVTPETAGPRFAGPVPPRPPAPGPYARLAPDDDDAEYGPPGAMPPGPAMAPRADVPPPRRGLPRADLPPGAFPPGAAPPPSAGVLPYPPPVIEAPRHKTKAANATPKTPMPRKRPEGAQSAKKSEPGSVAPLSPAPAPAPAPAQGATPTPAPETGNAMPPVAPLE